MTSDQVLIDEATAPDAVTSQSETNPKPVRRRTTKRVEAAEQPTLPETVAPTPSAVSTEAVATPEAAPEKQKRTRTRVAKPKAGDADASATQPTPTPAPKKTPDVASTIASSAGVEAGMPGVETPSASIEASPFASTPAIEVPAALQFPIQSPAGADPSSSARPSVPARFPSRFKRVHEPRPEVAPEARTRAPEVQAPVESVSEPRAEAEVSAPQTSQPFIEAPRTEDAHEQDGAPESRLDNGTLETGQDAAPESRDQNGAPPAENGAGDQNQNGDSNGQNGELPEGFGRMRYRERREFRRQQRMQQRQDRLGPNGEVLPFQEPRPQDGRPQDGRPQDGRVQPNGGGPSGGFNRGQNGFNSYPPQERQPQQRRREYDFFSLKAMGDEDLENAAREYGLEPDDSRGRDALLMALMEAQARTQNSVLKTGILDAHDHNKAFLRCEGYTPSEQDVYVSQTQIKRFNLKTGDLVFGTARAPKENERFFGLLRVESINDLAPEELRFRKDFEKLTPIFPDERYHLETEQTNITARIIDLVSPVGKGQRGLIVAPPKAGKTTLIKSIANSIALNNPDAELFVLLIDERPEEVTDISRSVRGTVVASTFDEMPENHMRVADIVMERAKRLVEMKQDVVILLDSITRLSRASNLVVTPSGRTLSGGLDPAAMYRPKRMFGAARNIEEGGSLTILATALVDTGSRMDEMIFEEFKGTGNMDLVLDRDLFNQRIFPAIDINKSGTRRDDLLLSKDELAATFHLRQTLARLDNDQAVKLLIDRLKNTKSNANFMEVVAKSARQAEVKGA